MRPTLEHDGVRLFHGEALEVLAELAAGSCDALVTDPPAGIGFMGKTWDTFAPGYLEQQAELEQARASLGPHSASRPGRQAPRSSSAFGDPAHYAGAVDRSPAGRAGFIAALAPVFRECLRVLKPGAHGLIWALPRTSHWTATALEDAGFEVRDVITHHYGSGFPKSFDISKGLDAAAGAQRELIRVPAQAARNPKAAGGGKDGQPGATRPWIELAQDRGYHEMPGDQPVTDAARRWQGWGTALKPASEHWILIRAPFAGTVAANVLEHGTGGLNVAGCRIEANGRPRLDRTGPGESVNCYGDRGGSRAGGQTDLGRWPANLVLSHGPDCGEPFAGAVWTCAPGCPVAELDEQSGEAGGWYGADTTAAAGMFGLNDGSRRTGFDDAGGASRFFYCAKPGREERDGGCEDLGRRPAGVTGWSSGGMPLRPDGTVRLIPQRGNVHPTVKPVALMRWLCRLVTPPGGLVLDPFVGSGTTLLAAHAEGFRAVGIEREASYVAIAEARMPRQYSLFADRED